jgi:hypothetical protein
MSIKKVVALTFPLLMLLNGCGLMIYSSGKDGDVLRQGTTESAIMGRFGPPIRSGTNSDGTYEVFRGTGKIVPNEENVESLFMSDAVTFGTYEAVLTPATILLWPYQAIGKKDVYVYYGNDGEYQYHEVYHAWHK